jgi:hypothetical protein
MQQQCWGLNRHPLPALAAAQAPLAAPLPTPALEALAAELRSAADIQERSRLLLGYARRLAPLPEAARSDAHRVMGCTAQASGWADGSGCGANRAALQPAAPARAAQCSAVCGAASRL